MQWCIFYFKKIMKNSKIKIFYTPKQVNTNTNIIGTTSRSPLKPMLLMRAFSDLGFDKHFDINSTFEPFTDGDFKLAHTTKYVDAFFKGEQPLCSSNGLPWSKELADSVRYTNASLYNAVRHSCLNPNQVSYSLTSGFHHAQPNNGSGFCTFSGQVIAAIKLYNEFGVSGAVLDLDGHRGNSIEDARVYSPDINHAIPVGFNFAQLKGWNKDYLNSLTAALEKIENAVLEDKIHYVLWCHGADSHDKDDLGGQVNTNYWVKSSEVFYAWVAKMDEKLALLGRSPLPVTLSLFGGYRRDSYASVLSLHIKDMQICMNTLCGAQIKYKVNVAEKYQENFPEKWINDGSGFYMPISLLRMTNPRKYMTDAEFNNTNLSKNEKLILEFLKPSEISNSDFFTGIELGFKCKGWLNHSMAKWAKKLVRRGLLEKVQQGHNAGYRLKKIEREIRQERPVAMHID
jgi:acetoin utilization deacetylase AcuC-like enzyme